MTKLCVPGLGDCAILDLLNDDGTVRRMDVAYSDAMPRDIARRLKAFPPVPGELQTSAFAGVVQVGVGV